MGAIPLPNSSFSMNRRLYLGLCLLLAVSFSSSAAQVAEARSVEEFDIASDAEMDRRFDWTITVKTTIDNKALNYPSSTLKPLAVLSAAYRMAPRFSKDGNAETYPYEDLWYHEGRAIGCRLYHRLNTPQYYQGAIRIVPSKDASQSPAAIANAIVRLMLDIGLRKCVLTVVFVPRDIFHEVQDNLTKFGFFPNQGTIPLFLFSDPYSQRVNLYHRDS